MTLSQSQFEAFLNDEVQKYKGVAVPVRASILQRLFVQSARCRKLHPNPGDEFCVPGIGPSYEIINRYTQEFAQERGTSRHYCKKAVIVEKIRPDGYMIMNGHHRWAAALRLNYPKIPIRIVNLTHEMDVRRMLENSRHDKRVALDLDEVVFRPEDDTAVEKPPRFPFNKLFPERVKLGIPALFHYLATSGYDIWVYTAHYESFDRIRALFRSYHVRVTGVVTGIARKNLPGHDIRTHMEKLIYNKYRCTVHIDNEAVIRVFSKTKEFEEHQLSGSAASWSREVMDIIGAMDRHD